MNIYIGEPKIITVSDMQGPCPSGFHVPLNTEWQAIYNAGVSLGAWSSSNGTNLSTYLKMPMAGNRNYSSGIYNVDSRGYYWSSKAVYSDSAYYIKFESSTINLSDYLLRTSGLFIRGLKNSSVIPDSSWTVLYQGTGTSGIYHNSTLGLISISSDGTTWYTLSDKNLGAATVWNSGDSLTVANTGNVFQWGNNYAFPGTLSSDSITTSSSQVNASTYGPGNYYESSTYISRAGSWDTSDNRDLWGGVTQGTSTKTEYQEVKNIYIGEYIPITEIGIYWSEADGVISFQTSAGSGISIADKDLGATTVLGQGKGYQWGNNYGWDYGVNPTSTSSTLVNASSYGPGNYYNSSTFILCSEYWDSSINNNLWGGTTDTYEARRGPCAEGWHIPSGADFTTLVNAISSITGGVDGTKITNYCKLKEMYSIDRGTGEWDTAGGWNGILSSDVIYYSRVNTYRQRLLYVSGSTYDATNENFAKGQGGQYRAFSNTFIQPTTSRTKLN